MDLGKVIRITELPMPQPRRIAVPNWPKPEPKKQPLKAPNWPKPAKKPAEV